MFRTDVEVEIDDDEIIDYLEDRGYTVIEPNSTTNVCNASCGDYGVSRTMASQMFEQFRATGTVSQETLSEFFYKTLGRII